MEKAEGATTVDLVLEDAVVDGPMLSPKMTSELTLELEEKGLGAKLATGIAGDATHVAQTDML